VRVFRAIRLFCAIAFRMYGTGKFRLFPYRHEQLLELGTFHELYKGKHTPEDFFWISPRMAWEIAWDIWR
jgi:hypothetical protein